METLAKNEGLITKIIGPVIDVEFNQEDLPEIYLDAVVSVEDHRFYDIRRWLIGTDPDYDNDIYAVNIVKLKSGYDPDVYPTGFRYEYPDTPVLQRVYEEKHNLYPILRDDTYIGPLFKQNPGWE